MNPKVCIIILNWNNWQDTVKCLESVYQINYPEYGVILVDNGSEDDSIKKIKRYYQNDVSTIHSYNKKSMKLLELQEEDLKTVPQTLSDFNNFKSTHLNKKLVIIKNSRNYGFTKGNNIGIKFALQNFEPDYMLLLNNDTIVDKHFLNEMIRVGEANQNIGFIGPKIYFYEYDGRFNCNVIQSVGGNQNLWRFEPHLIGHSELDKHQFDQNQEVGFISGACILVKTEMINDIGLLDENFFSYREENDWCMRGYKAGWKSIYSYKSLIWHNEQGSTKNKEIKPLVLYYMIKNKFLFINKHANKKGLIYFLGYFFLFDFWYWLLASIFYQKRLKMLNLKLTKCFLKAVYNGLNLLIKNFKNY